MPPKSTWFDQLDGLLAHASSTDASRSRLLRGRGQ
jgi:hypothetical protein